MIANVVKDLVAAVRVLSTGAPKVSSTIYVAIRLELDGDADDGKYWDTTSPSWVAAASVAAWPTATYGAAGDWVYQLPAAATSGKVSSSKPARLHWRMTDNVTTPASETASSGENEEMIYSSGAAEAATGAAASVTAGVTLAADQAVNVTKWSGTAVATPDTAGYPKVTLKSGTGTGEVNLSSGAVPVTGDLTATMKTSVTTAATAATPTVTAGTVSDKTGYSLATAPPTAAANAAAIWDDAASHAEGTKGAVLATVNANAAALAAALIDDAIAELTGDPGATPTALQVLMLVYMRLRNKGTSTATTDTIANNAGTTIMSAAKSDDGTTFTRNKFA